MSHPKLLHQNDFGYVSQCLTCGTLQVSLGNFLLSLPQAHFGAFVQAVHAVGKQAQPEVAHLHPLTHFRPYLIKTPVYHLYMAFSEEEYQQALELLSMAQIMFQSYQLLQ